MNSFDETLDFSLERALATQAIMLTLSSAPYDWMWDGPSPGNVGNQIQGVHDQIDSLADCAAETTLCAAHWDADISSLVADAAYGTRSARVKFKNQPIKLRLFANLRYPTVGRDKRYKQAHAFEKSWHKCDPAWVFKTGLTLALFKGRREAIVTVKEPAHVTADTNELHERAMLHSLADGLNGLSVDWYNIATGHFGEDTVAGQLIRTIPTTYDPNRAPAKLRFTAHLSAAPNHVHLVWRAARGERSFITAQRPGAADFELILDGVTDKEWLGLGVQAGLWRFKGHASNQHGQGEASEIIEITVAAAAAA